jgi:hypothetical protein
MHDDQHAAENRVIDPRRWTDDRLDDLAEAVWSMRDLPMRVAVMETEFKGIGDDIKAAAGGIEDIKTARENERVSRERARKEDRRWLIGTALSTVALVIAALAVFVN